MRCELLLGDCLDHLSKLGDETIDAVITSPPYDNLRTYDGYTSFNFPDVAKQISRVMKDGAVCVWIVGDATVNGSETGTSFRQALYFKDDCGLRLHDTMVWHKGCFTAVGALTTRYAPVFDYMFILSKGAPKTFNPIKDRPNKWAGHKGHGTLRLRDGTMRKRFNPGKVIAEFGQRFNVWAITPDKSKGSNKHPAMFPLSLVKDHIVSWTNPGDTILDPFLGSGTTAQAALETGRNVIGIDISERYIEIARERLGPLHRA